MAQRGVSDLVLGIIGTGAMGEALLRGILGRGILPPGRIIAYDIRTEQLARLGSELRIRTADGIARVAAEAEVVILAVKPQQMPGVLHDLAPHVGAGTLLVSVAAGVTTAAIENALPEGVRVVRVMPNTPALVGHGVAAVSRGRRATADDEDTVRTLLSAVGTVVSVDEALLDAVTGLSGSGPAYICLVVEALADGGVAEGLPRDVALRLAAETVRGTGELLCRALERGEHPAAVRDRVTSPGGTTAEGLGALEAAAVRAAFARAVRAAAARSRELGAR